MNKIQVIYKCLYVLFSLFSVVSCRCTGIDVSIENKSNHVIEGVAIVYGNKESLLGEINAGGNAMVKVHPLEEGALRVIWKNNEGVIFDKAIDVYIAPNLKGLIEIRIEGSMAVLLSSKLKT